MSIGILKDNWNVISNQFKLLMKDYAIKSARRKKTREGCPLMGYCPYDKDEPFDCYTCPSKSK